jgi:ketosteroid isomerase-like protein
MSYAFLSIAMLAMPAVAAAGDENLKQEAEKIGAVYADSFNKQDGAGIAALYASGGMIVNVTGPHTDVAQTYEGLFKAGFNHNEITVGEAWPLGADMLLAVGEYHITGKNQSGAPLDATGIWTATDVREGGKWKIRLLTAIPKPPQPPK